MYPDPYSYITRMNVALLVMIPVHVAWATTTRLWPNAPLSRRIVATLSIAMLIVWALVLLLGNSMLLVAWGLRFAITLLILVYAWVNWKQSSTAPSPPWRIDKRALAWTLPCLGVLACVAGRFYFDGIELFSDDLAYHFVVPAEWVRRGSLFHPTISFAHYYPFNPHAFAAAFMTLTRSVEEVWIAGLFWIVLVVATLLAFASVAPRAAAPLALVATLFLTSEMMLWFASRFCSSDLAGAASLLVAFLFIAPRDGADLAERRADLMLAALMAGFAVGCKPSMVVPAGVAAIAIAWSMGRGSGTRNEALRWIALAAGAFLITASYWYARNWIVAGNPLFPFRVGPFYGQIQSKHIDNTTIWYWIAKSPTDMAMWRTLLASLLDWPLYNGIVALGGLVAGGAMAAASYKRQGADAMLPRGLGWMLLAAVAFLAFHLKAPFSGGTLEATAMTVFPRYAMFAFLAGLALAAVALSALIPQRAGVGATIAVPRWLTTLGLLLAFVVIAGRPLVADRRDMPIDFVAEQRPLKLGIAALEQLPKGARIAALSTRTWENGYLYGSRLQFQPVWLDEFGQRMPPLHTVYNWQRRKMKQDYPRYGVVHTEATVQPERFVANVRASGIDYLFVTKYSFSTPTWSPLRDAVLASSDMVKIHDDGFSEIYTWRSPAEVSR